MRLRCRQRLCWHLLSTSSKRVGRAWPWAFRTGELRPLGFGQLSWAGHCRSAIVSPGIAEYGARQRAAESDTLDRDWLALALRAWALAGPGGFIVNETQPRFRQLFAEGLAALRCAEWRCAPYSEARRRYGALAAVGSLEPRDAPW